MRWTQFRCLAVAIAVARGVEASNEECDTSTEPGVLLSIDSILTISHEYLIVPKINSHDSGFLESHKFDIILEFLLK